MKDDVYDFITTGCNMVITAFGAASPRGQEATRLRRQLTKRSGRRRAASAASTNVLTGRPVVALSGETPERVGETPQRAWEARERVGNSCERVGNSCERVGNSCERVSETRERVSETRERVSETRERVCKRRKTDRKLQTT